MLKNKEERQDYIRDDNNCEPLVDNPLVKVEKLKGVNIARVKALVTVYDWIEGTPQENEHFSEIGTFELAKDGKSFQSICSLSYTAILEVVKNAKDN